MEQRKEQISAPKIGLGTYAAGIVIVALYSVVMTWLAGFNQGQVYPGRAVYYDIGFNKDYFMPPYWWLLVMPIISILLTGFIFKFKKFSAQSLAVITTMLLCTVMIPTNQQAFTSIHAIATAIPAGDPWKTYALEESNMPFLVPDLNDQTWLKPYLYGGGPIPWGLWALPMLWFILQGTFLYLTFVFSSVLFRRQYIDVEHLNYNLSVPLAWSINDATASDKPKGFGRLISNRMFWIGILIGVLLEYPTWVGRLFEGVLPGNYLWAFTYDATPLNIPLFNYTPLIFIISGFAIGLALLVPIGILQSYLLGWAIFEWVIPQVLVATGVLPLMPAGQDHYSAFLSYIYPIFTPVSWANLKWSYGLYQNWIFGSMWAVFFWPLFTTGRKNFIASIKAIFSKPPPELEANEPIPYRWTWMGLLGCGVITVLLMYIGSDGLMPIGYGILWILVAVLYCGFVATRFGGIFTDVNGYPGALIFLSDSMPWSQFQTWLVANTASPFYTDNPTVGFKTLMVSNYGTYGGTYWSQSFPGLFTMQSFSVARLTNTPNKNILLGILMAIPVAFIFSLISNVAFTHTYGILNQWANSGLMGFSASWSNLVMYMVTHRTYIYQWFPEGGVVPPPATIYIAQAGGFIITAVLFILRARFPWWPIHPAGWIGAFVFDPGFLLPVIIALVVKRLILRTGGTKLWEEKGMPFAFGMAISLGLVLVPLLFYNAFSILAA